jgi:hypothetical protein
MAIEESQFLKNTQELNTPFKNAIEPKHKADNGSLFINFA